MPKCAAAQSTPLVSGLRTRKDIWTLVLFGKMTRHVSDCNLTVGVISSKKTSVQMSQMSFRMRRPVGHHMIPVEEIQMIQLRKFKNSNLSCAVSEKKNGRESKSLWLVGVRGEGE